VTPQDIVAFDGSSFSLFLDGSDVGLESTSENIDAIAIIGGTLLVSTEGSYAVPGVSGQDEDVIALSPGLRGATSTGSWSMYFDGGNAGLTASGEDVDAFEPLADGRLLISTAGAVSVAGVSGVDKDVLAFTPSTGGWAMYFNGTDVALTTSGEDIDGVAVDASGSVYLSTRNTFNVASGAASLSGADEDVFACNSPTTDHDVVLLVLARLRREPLRSRRKRPVRDRTAVRHSSRPSRTTGMSLPGLARLAFRRTLRQGLRGVTSPRGGGGSLIQRTDARDHAHEDAVAPGAPFMRIAASVLVLSGALCVLFAVRAAAAPDSPLGERLERRPAGSGARG
jgi:hypothetical protein